MIHERVDSPYWGWRVYFRIVPIMVGAVLLRDFSQFTFYFFLLVATFIAILYEKRSWTP